MEDPEPMWRWDPDPWLNRFIWAFVGCLASLVVFGVIMPVIFLVTGVWQ